MTTVEENRAQARVDGLLEVLRNARPIFGGLMRGSLRWSPHLDPDGKAPAEEPEHQRELRVRTGSDGAVSLTGKLDPEGGARVLEVLNSLDGRRPPIDGIPDTRSPARRNGDALVEAMSCLLDEGELSARVGNAPTWFSP